MTFTELEKIKREVEKTKNEVVFAFTNLIAKIDSIGMKSASFEADPSEDKPPF
jgi:hypothetical protein